MSIQISFIFVAIGCLSSAIKNNVLLISVIFFIYLFIFFFFFFFFFFCLFLDMSGTDPQPSCELYN